jgi:hypothetical protein
MKKNAAAAAHFEEGKSFALQQKKLQKINKRTSEERERKEKMFHNQEYLG